MGLIEEGINKLSKGKAPAKSVVQSVKETRDNAVETNGAGGNSPLHGVAEVNAKAGSGAMNAVKGVGEDLKAIKSTFTKDNLKNTLNQGIQMFKGKK